MKAGMVVKIYQQPINETGYEGEARLDVRYEKDIAFEHDWHIYQAWWVRFLDDEIAYGENCPTYHRVVRVQGI